jgi:four helix bundle protein
MNGQVEDLRRRTKRFSVEIIRFLRTLPKSDENKILAKQLLRSATSIAANYRAAGRSRSRTEFAARLGVVIEEADETMLWLELMSEADLASTALVLPLLDEADQLLRIFVASRKTARQRQRV